MESPGEPPVTTEPSGAAFNPGPCKECYCDAETNPITKLNIIICKPIVCNTSCSEVSLLRGRLSQSVSTCVTCYVPFFFLYVLYFSSSHTDYLAKAPFEKEKQSENKGDYESPYSREAFRLSLICLYCDPRSLPLPPSVSRVMNITLYLTRAVGLVFRTAVFSPLLTTQHMS